MRQGDVLRAEVEFRGGKLKQGDAGSGGMVVDIP